MTDIPNETLCEPVTWRTRRRARHNEILDGGPVPHNPGGA